MSGKKLVAVIVLVAALFAGAGFAAGRLLGGSAQRQQLAFGPGAGGPMSQLTEAERQQLQNMTDEERRQFLQEKFGGSMPASGTAGARGPRGGLLEGEVIEAAADSITLKLALGGSQTVYLADDTVLAYQEGAPRLGTGTSVLVMAEPTANGDTTSARLVVVLTR